MSTTIVLGAQWGDEGKGKVTDFFASKADLVVRFQGGNNAGHTIVVDDEKFALSMVPSWVMYDTCTPVIASGCVVDFEVLKKEIDSLNQKNIDTSNLKSVEKVVGKKGNYDIYPEQQGDVPHTYADITIAKKDLDYQPKTPLTEGLTKMYMWYKEIYN